MSWARAPNRRRTIMVYDVTDNGTKPVTNGKVLIDAGPGGGSPDGFRVDIDGNLQVRLGHGQRRT